MAGALLAFTFSFDDFIIAFFTSGQDQTVPIYLFASIRRGVSPQVNAIATVLLCVTIIAMVTAGLVYRRGQRRAAVPAEAPVTGLLVAARGAHGMSTRVLAGRPGPSRPLLTDVVRDGLRRAIFAGEYPPGSKLPNEDLLATRFAVSRTTIREAVRGLAEEGYLVRRQGSGTFVTARPLLRNSLDTNFSYTAYLESTGVRGGRRILGLQTVAADDVVAEQLGMEPGEPVVELRRVRTADDKPAVYSIDRMPADIVDERRDREALGGSIYALLAARGHPVSHGGAIVAPASADKESGRPSWKCRAERCCSTSSRSTSTRPAATCCSRWSGTSPASSSSASTAAAQAPPRATGGQSVRGPGISMLGADPKCRTELQLPPPVSAAPEPPAPRTRPSATTPD